MKGWWSWLQVVGEVEVVDEFGVGVEVDVMNGIGTILK